MLTAAFVFETSHALGGPAPLPVRLGVETYGELNAARDNAVLVCHYYTGTQHAAGRYTRSELETPGWWDDLIGPGKAVDTDRFFVVCMNTPSNVQSRDPRVVTTGPDTAHADGEPYGERFPHWGFADLIELQLGLMRHLGVPAWHAVIGPSLGGMQALQWAARCPQYVPRVAAIGTSPRAGVVLREVFAPLLRAAAECDGLEGALRLISFFGMGSDGMHATFGAPDADLGQYIRSRAGHASLRHVQDIGRLAASHDLTEVAPFTDLADRWAELGTRVLTVNVRGDQFFPAAEMRGFAHCTQSRGVRHEHLEYDSTLGHLGIVFDTAPFAPRLRALLEDHG